MKAKLLLGLAAALLLAGGCATTTSADGTKVSRVGKWEVRPNTPFRTEEGPIERYEDASDTAVVGTTQPRT